MKVGLNYREIQLKTHLSLEGFSSQYNNTSIYLQFATITSTNQSNIYEYELPSCNAPSPAQQQQQTVIGGSRGRQRRTPPRSNFFNFRAFFFGKQLNNSFSYPPVGNPGSTTDCSTKIKIIWTHIRRPPPTLVQFISFHALCATTCQIIGWRTPLGLSRPLGNLGSATVFSKSLVVLT